MGRQLIGRAALLMCVAVAWPGCAAHSPVAQRLEAAADCAQMLTDGFREVAETPEGRFLGKVEEHMANCRGGTKAVSERDTPWLDWSNYFATGDASSRAGEGRAEISNRIGVDGALLDLEIQRLELIKFNLLDNSGTYADYVLGRDDTLGPVLRVWPEMRLPSDHPRYADVGGDRPQVCQGDLIRHRTLTGICNDIKNPLMGSTGQLFARNVAFESTFPRLDRTDLVRNRHGDRLGLLRPDPQVISRRLFTRRRSDPDRCRDGEGLPGASRDANCDYKKAPFFNVLAAFWVQFMTHDWFAHVEEGHNREVNGRPDLMSMGCETQLVDNVETPLTPQQIAELGCRPADQVDRVLIADASEPPTFDHDGRSRLTRSPETSRNRVTAWWDASQLYGYDEVSRQRVKRDPDDRAKLLMVNKGNRAGAGERYGYLPLLETCEGAPAGCMPDPMNPAWKGQEATAFPDNWNIGLSWLHNVFAREHSIIVDTFRQLAEDDPDGDSGLRDPSDPTRVIRHADVTDDELFEITRLIVAAEIAKIHTIEWTPQLLYNEPLYLGMNANWGGLLAEDSVVAEALEQLLQRFRESEEVRRANQLYAALAAGPGIVGLGNRVNGRRRVLGLFGPRPDVWSLSNPDHVNGGVTHFGSPFNFPEEFTSVYRLHPLIPDLIDYREFHSDPNVIREKLAVLNTFRGKATPEMESRGLANLALSMGRQRLGLLTLQNHPLFMQNLPMPRLGTQTNQIDIAALDIIRDRELGIPRFNEFRRQIGLKTLTGFGDFIDQRLPVDHPARAEQAALVGILREVYGQHRCDASRVITDVQVDDGGQPITDCLGHPDGSMVNNIEDVDLVVGILAESTRPHGFAISETQFHIFIINASRRLFSDRFLTSSFRSEFYTQFGIDWVNNNGPGDKVWEAGEPNGHKQQVSPFKRILLRVMPELAPELAHVVNAFDPWARDRGEYYSLAWTPRPGAESDEAFAPAGGDGS